MINRKPGSTGRSASRPWVAEPAGGNLVPRSRAEVRLDLLPPRSFGTICRMEAPDEDSERMMAMGVCAGRTVELVMPGDPLILRVFASRIGLSARLARRVYVLPLDDNPSSSGRG